jgi:hypothetical protein
MSSRPALGSSQPPTQTVPVTLSPGVKRPRREGDQSPPASAEVKKMWIYTSTPPYAFMALCSIKHRNNFTFYYYYSSWLSYPSIQNFPGTNSTATSNLTRNEVKTSVIIMKTTYPEVASRGNSRMSFMLNVFQRMDNVEHCIGKTNQPLSQIFGESTIQSFAKNMRTRKQTNM